MDILLEIAEESARLDEYRRLIEQLGWTVEEKRDGISWTIAGMHSERSFMIAGRVREDIWRNALQAAQRSPQSA